MAMAIQPNVNQAITQSMANEVAVFPQDFSVPGTFQYSYNNGLDISNASGYVQLYPTSDGSMYTCSGGATPINTAPAPLNWANCSQLPYLYVVCILVA
jgi:hypothetical protein